MIFGKLGTTEKVIVACVRTDAPLVMGRLNQMFGGDWVWCETLNWQKREFVKFNDSIPYKGFHGNPERYCGDMGSLEDIWANGDEKSKELKNRFA